MDLKGTSVTQTSKLRELVRPIRARLKTELATQRERCRQLEQELKEQDHYYQRCLNENGLLSRKVEVAQRKYRHIAEEIRFLRLHAGSGAPDPGVEARLAAQLEHAAAVLSNLLAEQQANHAEMSSCAARLLKIAREYQRAYKDLTARYGTVAKKLRELDR